MCWWIAANNPMRRSNPKAEPSGRDTARPRTPNPAAGPSGSRGRPGVELDGGSARASDPPIDLKGKRQILDAGKMRTRPVSVVEAFLGRAKSTPEKLCVRFDGERW